MRHYIIFSLLILFGFIFTATAQDSLDVRSMTKNQLRSLQYDQLIELSLDDLLFVSEKLGLSIDDLLQDPTTVSSRTALSSRETPGIISVLNRTDIIESGAHDLAGLLRTIPGIYMGNDVDGVIGIIMRGNWGHEGKVLFLLDDMELNENMYSVTHLLNHIPASQISRIEVVRGPGSALYGGYAELGVIKITTLTGEQINGAELSAAAGTFGNNISSNGLGFSAGNRKNNQMWTVMATWNSADAARGTISSFEGDEYDMNKGWLNSKNLFINMKYSLDQLDAQFVYDDFSIVPIGYETMNYNRFRSYFSQLKYNLQAGKNLNFTPYIRYKSQTPYWFEDPSEDDYWFYRRNANQLMAGSDIVWTPVDKFHLISGIGFRYDMARITDEEQEKVGDTFYNDEFAVNHSTPFGYLQGNYSTKIGNFFAGARAEQNTITGFNMAPRLGYTHIINNFNIKYLYSHAFRSPSIENVNINPEIEIEKTLVNELALGYRLNDYYYLSANLYDIIIKDPIVYSYDYENDEEDYFNDLGTGSTGIEMELKTMYRRWSAGLSYSFFDASRHNKSEIYGVILPDGPMQKMMKGAPAHMIHLNGNYNLNQNITLSSTASWYSARFGYITSAEEQSKVNPYLLVNINLMYRNIFIDKLDAMVSINNLTNSSYEYIQPVGSYGLAERPFPGRPLEIVLKLQYRIYQDHR